MAEVWYVDVKLLVLQGINHLKRASDSAEDLDRCEDQLKAAAQSIIEARDTIIFERGRRIGSKQAVR